MADVVEVHVYSHGRHMESKAFEDGDHVLRAYLTHWEEETRRRLNEGIIVSVQRRDSTEVRMRMKKNRTYPPVVERRTRYDVLTRDET